jgi:hypothetical protein
MRQGSREGISPWGDEIISLSQDPELERRAL